MTITEEINRWIATHGSERDALNVALAKLHQAQYEIAVLEEAAQADAQPTLLHADCGGEIVQNKPYCKKCRVVNPHSR